MPGKIHIVVVVICKFEILDLISTCSLVLGFGQNCKPHVAIVDVKYDQEPKDHHKIEHPTKHNRVLSTPKVSVDLSYLQKKKPYPMIKEVVSVMFKISNLRSLH